MTQLSILDAVIADTPGRFHAHGPDTERKAAFGIRTGTQRHRVLQELHRRGLGGATDYELHASLGLLRTAAGTRRKELQELGLVERTGETRPTDTGHDADVHRLNEQGLRVAGELS